MGRVVLHHGTGAKDFQLNGSPLVPEETKRYLLNARRILVARGDKEAVALLDSIPFFIFPATNHFNDDFNVLQAELPLIEYEAIRLSQELNRQAAARIAEAMDEAEQPIRFVAIDLALVDPEAWDVFICHASEDKLDIARPLHAHLESSGIRCWLDEAEIAWGESIVSKIQEGIARARFVLVILSPTFLSKPWAQKELRASLAIEIATERNIVLPLLVGDPEVLLSSSPFLKDKRYLEWDGDPKSVERELRTLVRKQSRQSP